MRRDAAAIVRTRLRSTLGLSAVITRGQQSGQPIVVVLGRSNMVATALNEFRIVSDAQEVFVQASDYAPCGEPCDPENNDRITVTMPDGSIANFEVRTPDKSQDCFQNTTFATELRVHCRHVAEIPDSI